MPLDFDLKHAFWAAAGATAGALGGYLLGIVLYIITVSAAAFVPANSPIATILTAVVSGASTFPLEVSMMLAALGFFGGYYFSSKKEEEKENNKAPSQ
ncbi:MAG: hypothetical protein RXR31_02725 [Thermoproteota archaeon]